MVCNIAIVFLLIMSSMLGVSSSSCLPPMNPPYGDWICSSSLSTSFSCTLVCDPGWIVQGRSTLTCEGGNWTDPGINFGCTAVEAVMIAGNSYDSTDIEALKTAEIYGQYHGRDIQMEVARLSEQRTDATLNYVNSQVLMCGGWGGGRKTCSRFYPDSGTGSWNETYALSEQYIGRETHMSVILGDKLYLIGGDNEPKTTEYIEVCKSHRAQPGISLASESYRGCAVSISHDTFVVVGGASSDCGNSHYACGKRTVIAYNITSKSHYELPNLRYARMDHDCVMYRDRKTEDVFILVTGGRYEGESAMGNTEMLRVGGRAWEQVGDLNYARSHLALAVLEKKILAIGGLLNGKPTDIVEEFDFTTNTWKITKRMLYPRYGHAVTEIPSDISNSC